MMSWLQEFYIPIFYFFTRNFYQVGYCAKCKVWFKKHALELFQYSSVLFDNRFERNNDLKSIVEMTRPNKHQSRTVGQIVELPSNFMHCGAKF